MEEPDREHPLYYFYSIDGLIMTVETFNLTGESAMRTSLPEESHRFWSTETNPILAGLGAQKKPLIALISRHFFR